MRAAVWLALRLGRVGMRPLLWPACLYFLFSSRQTRATSAEYLTRVRGKPAGLIHVFRHYLTFATCVLDRIYLLNNQADRYRIAIHGEDIVDAHARAHRGCLLFGAHLGSFEVLRAVGQSQPDLKVSMVMYGDNAHKINAALGTINPTLDLDIIALGRPGALVTLQNRLATGYFAGVLADRSPGSEDMRRLPFLGTPAAFPEGPFRMAAMLGHPVVMMFGLFRGGRRYDIHFEELEVTDIDRAMEHYVARLEHHCRAAPYNWFNFYRFWS